MRKLYFAVLRWLNDGEPSIQEALYVLQTKYRFTSQMLRSRKTTAMMLTLYTAGHSLEHIAKVFKVTRERVRQMIRKACRGV